MWNAVKTVSLLAGLTALVGVGGLFIGGSAGLITAFSLMTAINVAAWWFSDKLVLSFFRTTEVKEGRAYDLTKQLAAKAGMPMPKVHIMNSNQLNACATGRNPKKGVVIISTGLMDALDDRELSAVIAHELSHIKNYDTLTMTMTAAMAGTISLAGRIFMFGGGRRDNNIGGALAGVAVMLASMILAPMIQLAVSRTREYAADHSGGDISGDPRALASALQKIDASIRGGAVNTVAERIPATAHMFIANPFKGKGSGDSFFSTHPSMENRIKALYNQAAEMDKKTGVFSEAKPEPASTFKIG